MSAWPHEYNGVPVFVNEFVPVGRPIYSVFSTGDTIVMHPLDLIAVQYAGDALGRLDAAMEYLIARAHRDLDTLAERLDLVDPPARSRYLQIAHAQHEEDLARGGLTVGEGLGLPGWLPVSTLRSAVAAADAEADRFFERLQRADRDAPAESFFSWRPEAPRKPRRDRARRRWMLDAITGFFARLGVRRKR